MTDRKLQNSGRLCHTCKHWRGSQESLADYESGKWGMGEHDPTEGWGPSGFCEALYRWWVADAMGDKWDSPAYFYCALHESKT